MNLYFIVDCNNKWLGIFTSPASARRAREDLLEVGVGGDLRIEYGGLLNKVSLDMAVKYDLFNSYENITNEVIKT